MRKKNTKKVTLDKKPFIVLTRRRIGVWACILFLVCAWMFGLGIWVGRGTAPVKFDIDKLEKKLQASRTESRRPDKSAASKGSGVAKDKTNLEFYEALKDNRADAGISDFKMPPVVSKKIEPSSEKSAETSKKKTLVKKPETGKPVANTKTARAPVKVKPGSSPQKKPAPTQKGKSAPAAKTRSVGKIYTIQVASVKDGGDADQLVAKLKKRGYPAYRAIAKIPDKGIWFRVRIGEFKGKSDAGPTITKLKKDGIKPILVKK